LLRPALTEASDLIAEAFGADKADVFVYDPSSDSLVALGTSRTPMGERQHALGLNRLAVSNGGRAGWAFRTGEVHLTGRADEDPEELRGVVDGLGIRSAANLPIVIEGERRGVLQADSATPDFFSERDRDALAAVAGWVGLVMHRAELSEQAAETGERRGERRAAEELKRITPRQREVAVEIAAGLSNAGIARRLTLTEGTVANHIEAILRRLDLESRTQIAVWAVERGLYSSADRDEPDGVEATNERHRWPGRASGPDGEGGPESQPITRRNHPKSPSRIMSRACRTPR
jgi:DNA-binding CsgD family transcriptional regulator